MEKRVRDLVTAVIQENSTVLRIACRQRAKCEGWVKFSLAAIAESRGAQDVRVECADENSRCLSDLSFTLDGEHVRLELKTANTSWRIDGASSATRPITKNVADIVADVRKLKRGTGRRLMAFILFPVPTGDLRWTVYLARLARATGLQLTEEDHCDRVAIELGDGHRCEVVVCCFEVGEAPTVAA